MKENKYRVWDLNKKKMFYDGDLYSPFNYKNWELKEKVYPCQITNKGILVCNKLNNEQSNDYIELVMNGKRQTYYSSWEVECLYSRDIIIMKYTEQVDDSKEHNEIYDNDIIRGFWSERINDDHDVKKCNDIALVFWDEYKLQWMVEEFKTTGEKYPLYDYCDEIERIGNKYENPELLEEK